MWGYWGAGWISVVGKGGGWSYWGLVWVGKGVTWAGILSFPLKKPYCFAAGLILACFLPRPPPPL